MVILKMVFKGEFPTLNEVIRDTKKHWYRYSKGKKDHTKVVRIKALEDYLPILQSDYDGTIVYPIGLQFDWYRKNKRTDPDNVAFAKKYILDGLQEADIIGNDNWAIIQGFRDSFYIDKKNPRVEVSIYKIENF